MTEGPTQREIERVREALKTHDTELRSDDESQEDEPEQPSEEDREDG